MGDAAPRKSIILVRNSKIYRIEVSQKLLVSFRKQNHCAGVPRYPAGMPQDGWPRSREIVLRNNVFRIKVSPKRSVCKLKNKIAVQEYNAIRQACREMGDPAAEYCPPITYITVLKRHKARLFPGDNASRDHIKGNVKPGTCVDDGIALRHGFDFYLNSHVGIQGTVKPAHYHVLCDENNFGADALQIATYWLCYTFCRCTRSVSYCPPAYYARALPNQCFYFQNETMFFFILWSRKEFYRWWK